MLTRQRAPQQREWTPLHCAAAGGKEGAIGVLLEAGADREAKNFVSGEREGGGGRAEGREVEGKYAGRGRWLGLAGRC